MGWEGVDIMEKGFELISIQPSVHLNNFVKTSPKFPPFLWGRIQYSTKQSKNKKP
jgi:hypothetical protein